MKLKATKSKIYETLRDRLIPQAEREADEHVAGWPPCFVTELAHARFFGARMQELAEAQGLTDGMPKEK